MGRLRKYFTEEEKKTAQRENERRYRETHKDKIAAKNAGYSKTPIGRANILVGSYRRNDKKHNRGECTLTPDWIVDNIFSQPCHYCGKTDWHELGCDRIDNNLPHTPNNVVPCCWECNNKKKNSL